MTDILFASAAKGTVEEQPPEATGLESEAEHQRLEEQVESAENDLRCMEAELNLVQAEATRLRAENKVLRAKTQPEGTRDRDANRNEVERGTLQSQVARLTAENTGLRAKAERVAQECEQLRLAASASSTETRVPEHSDGSAQAQEEDAKPAPFDGPSRETILADLLAAQESRENILADLLAAQEALAEERRGREVAEAALVQLSVELDQRNAASELAAELRAELAAARAKMGMMAQSSQPTGGEHIFAYSGASIETVQGVTTCGSASSAVTALSVQTMMANDLPVGNTLAPLHTSGGARPSIEGVASHCSVASAVSDTSAVVPFSAQSSVTMGPGSPAAPFLARAQQPSLSAQASSKSLQRQPARSISLAQHVGLAPSPTRSGESGAHEMASVISGMVSAVVSGTAQPTGYPSCPGSSTTSYSGYPSCSSTPAAHSAPPKGLAGAAAQAEAAAVSRSSQPVLPQQAYQDFKTQTQRLVSKRSAAQEAQTKRRMSGPVPATSPRRMLSPRPQVSEQSARMLSPGVNRVTAPPSFQGSVTLASAPSWGSIPQLSGVPQQLSAVSPGPGAPPPPMTVSPRPLGMSSRGPVPVMQMSWASQMASPRDVSPLRVARATTPTPLGSFPRQDSQLRVDCSALVPVPQVAPLPAVRSVTGSGSIVTGAGAQAPKQLGSFPRQESYGSIVVPVPQAAPMPAVRSVTGSGSIVTGAGAPAPAVRSVTGPAVRSVTGGSLVARGGSPVPPMRSTTGGGSLVVTVAPSASASSPTRLPSNARDAGLTRQAAASPAPLLVRTTSPIRGVSQPFVSQTNSNAAIATLATQLEVEYMEA